eukprot:CAMPEP_0197597102 /NCGR_PEP_ID=MMETSP1326-20131121/26588_1 /TAXON_ID=1155430 /ORGANISM="Genus nov. species nov., Strain RCC2288" /LENGTH=210 /DNA_ID=CAMNT_0043163719 /DNA_START=37 /DNA_END=669 /DNA_ORIENTATION=-
MADQFGIQGQKLVMAMFRSQTKAGRKKRLLGVAEKIATSGAVEIPKWLEPMRTVSPSSWYQTGPKPMQIRFPEDKLVRAYYNRHPTAKFLPIDLASDRPHFVRAFALRQLEVMQSGVSERDALRLVEREAMEEERNAQQMEKAGEVPERALTPTYKLETNRIAKIQAEEERFWKVGKEVQQQEMLAKQLLEQATGTTTNSSGGGFYRGSG